MVSHAKYRKLNDSFDSDTFEEEHNNLPEHVFAVPDASAVQELINSNQFLEALKLVLTPPPLKSWKKEQKEATTHLTLRVLQSFKTSDIESAVGLLNSEEGDVVMKYVYAAMSLSSDASVCHLLHLWHAQLVAKFGYGCIVRVFSDY